MRTLKALILTLPFLILGGCFEYAEDVTTNSNGTGALRSDIGLWTELLDEDAVRELRQGMKEAAAELTKDPAVISAEASDAVQGVMHHFVLLIKVKEYRTISRLVGSNGLMARMAQIQGREGIQFDDLENGRIRFTRLFDSNAMAGLRARATAKIAEVRRARPMLKMTQEDPFKDRFVTFRFHAPKIFGANLSGIISGGTAEWKFPIEFDALRARSDDRLEAEFSLQGLRTLWLILGGVAVIAMAFWLRGLAARGVLRRQLHRVGLM